jgi:catalase
VLTGEAFILLAEVPWYSRGPKSGIATRMPPPPQPMEARSLVFFVKGKFQMSTKPERKMEQPDALSREALQAFDDLTGLQPGYRPVHAKGILLSGTFTASASGKELTKAPHVRRESVPVVVRFSDFAGVPTVPDYDVENASPRGCAVRFFLAEHSHTDVIGHSVNGFPVRTVEEFLQFLRALGASGPGAAKPTPVEVFLGSHPAALAFVQAPKPIPTSFAKESCFGG